MQTNNRKFIDENFFVIDSDNLNLVEPRLYGYVLLDNTLLINGSINHIPIMSYGNYVNVSRTEKSLLIQQDYLGGYGLYLYQKDNFFAISNSFFKLLSFLKDKIKKMTLNIDYSNYFITETLSSLSASETLISEITLVQKDVLLEINLLEKKINSKNIRLDDESFNIDSPEGISILDNWYYKWQSCILGLQAYNESIILDLSGGFDSRATLSLFNTDSISLDDILVYSKTSKLHTFQEDYKIAILIANKMGFKINNTSYENKPISQNLVLLLNLLNKLGIHNQLNMQTDFYTKKVFRFTGNGGEIIRFPEDLSIKDIIYKAKRKSNFESIDLEKSIKRILEPDLSYYLEKFSGNEIIALNEFYKNTWVRSHSGKGITRNFLRNCYNMNPLTDAELQKIHDGSDLLLAVIYDRFLSNISDIPFQGNRQLNDKLIKKAQEINRKYTFKKIDISNKKFIIHDNKQFQPELDGDNDNLDTDLYDRYISNILHLQDKDFFKKYHSDVLISLFEILENKIKYLYGDEIYYRAKNLAYTKGYFKNYAIVALIAVLSAYLCTISDDINLKEYRNPLGLNFHSNFILKVINTLKTARVDIKNRGESNNLEIIDSNGEHKITTPKWFQEDGSIGYVVESNALSMNLNLKCIGSGDLTIALGGLDMNNNQGRYPIHIEYTSLQINGKEYLNNSVVAWHDDRKIIKIPVNDTNKINISIKWLPYSYNEKELVETIHKLFHYPRF